MSSASRMTAGTARHSAYYFGGLDGLRFLAFLAVFGDHLPAPAAIGLVSTHGWVGVELFFAISAFLLFRLLAAEDAKNGEISVKNFYVRRVLRIYPLLATYYALTFIGREGFLHPMAWLRFGTTMASVDNILVWWRNYNYTVQGVGHLWTLAFEVQIYAVLPFAFLAWRRWGTPRFLAGLLAVEILAFAVRCVAISAGAPHVGIYVIPYFRPESILLGLALAVTRPRWPPWVSLLVAVAAGLTFLAIDNPSQVYVYFLVGVMAVAFVDAAVRFSPLRSLLSLSPIRYLGTISYGLYVFHVVAIYAVLRVVQRVHIIDLYNRFWIITLSLALTVLVAAISYHYLEQPFLKLKRRFTAVEGR